MNVKNWMAALPALALAACAVGPDYATPAAPELAAAPLVGSDHDAFTTTAPMQDDWWRLYDDPVLDQLVTEALAANTDLRAATARLARARALLREARGVRLPQAELSTDIGYGRASQGLRMPGADREDWSVDAGLDLAYEVDLFRRLGRGVEAAGYDVEASEADRGAVRIAIVAETARAYAEAASAAERRAVAERIVALLDRSITLTERRRDVGLATRLDVARIAALRNQRQAQVPAIEAERNAALFRLATLIGRPVQALPTEAASRVTALRLDQAIPVGDGAALLARRPDVHAAERRLAAATARIGVATADLYPRITLGASVGSTGNGFENIFGAGPLNWLVGSLLSWSVNPEPARARIAAAEADTAEALAGFDGAVLKALEETQTAMSNYAKAIERRSALAAALRDAEVAANISRARQREGDIDSLALLDAERTYAEAQAELAAADAAIPDAQIGLFRALGGSWSS